MYYFMPCLLKRTSHPEVCLLTFTRTQLLDAALNERVYQEILAAAQAAGTPRVVLDWQRVRFLSGETAEGLRLVQEDLNRKGGGLIFRGVSPLVGVVLRLTGVIGREDSVA